MLRKAEDKVIRAVKGFRLPMLEYEEDVLDIRDQILIDRDNTHYMRMDSDVMADYGIFKGNILIIDKSITPVSGTIVIAHLNGEWYAREYIVNHKEVILKAGDNSATIKVQPEDSLLVWGVVTVNINRLLPDFLRQK